MRIKGKSVLGTIIYTHDIQTAINEVLNERDDVHQSRCISATGAHGLVFSKRNPEFKQVLDSFYINLPDGMPTVWVGRMKGAKSMKRCYGPDFFMEMMRSTSKMDITHFLCGGKEGVANKLKNVCENEFFASIAGVYCPPFLKIDEYDYQSIANEINKSGADIVWVGLSTPKQEHFAIRLSKYTSAKYICCVGAAFDFHIGNVKQAPSWIQGIGMEWFFRLLMEPGRLWKRYFEIVPLFIYYNFAELLTRKFFSNN